LLSSSSLTFTRPSLEEIELLSTSSCSNSVGRRALCRIISSLFVLLLSPYSFWRRKEADLEACRLFAISMRPFWESYLLSINNSSRRRTWLISNCNANAFSNIIARACIVVFIFVRIQQGVYRVFIPLLMLVLDWDESVVVTVLFEMKHHCERHVLLPFFSPLITPAICTVFRWPKVIRHDFYIFKGGSTQNKSIKPTQHLIFPLSKRKRFCWDWWRYILLLYYSQKQDTCVTKDCLTRTHFPRTTNFDANIKL
jgi:hypothetical protein